MPTYGWGTNEPEIKPVSQGGDTIATYATKVKNAISDLFDTLNTFPWANATQSSAGFMSKDDKKAVDGIADLGTFKKIYFSQTSGSFTAPRTGVYRITLKAGGGGGGGARSDVFCTGAGGGEGGALIFYVNLTKDQSYPYTIGAGGAGGVSGDTSTATRGDPGGYSYFNGTQYAIQGGDYGQRLNGGGFGGLGGISSSVPTGAQYYIIPGKQGQSCVAGASKWLSAYPLGGGQSSQQVIRKYGLGGAGAAGTPNSSSSTVTYEAQAGSDGFILIEYAE